MRNLSNLSAYHNYVTSTHFAKDFHKKLSKKSFCKTVCAFKHARALVLMCNAKCKPDQSVKQDGIWFLCGVISHLRQESDTFL